MNPCALLALAALLCACRGADEPAAFQTVCVQRLPPYLAHARPDALPARTWFQLLFKESGKHALDCSGEPIAWPPLADACVQPEPVAAETPHRGLTRSDLIVRHAGGHYWFGWVAHRRFADGMVEGPIAIARSHGGTLEIRALGTLRAYAEGAQFEVIRVGSQHVLVAQGEYCADGGRCQRATRLMWLSGQRFWARPLRDAQTRACLGPAWFPESEVLDRPVSPRWRRTLQRNLSLGFGADQIAVDEHMSVTDRDLQQPSLPPRLFREAQGRAELTIDGGEFLRSGRLLWDTLRIDDGSTGGQREL